MIPRRALFSLPLLLALPPLTVEATPRRLERLRGRKDEVTRGRLQRLAYGHDPKQVILHSGISDSTKGVFVFIHGGGWSIGSPDRTEAKPDFAKALGYDFASLGYRLVPSVTPREQAQDLARALARLVALGPQTRGRIILSGHSAGAHLAALVTLDRAYLKAEGLGADLLQALILLDGAGYDIPAQMAYLKTERPRRNPVANQLAGMYDAAFTQDPVTQKALSPFHQIRRDGPAYPPTLSFPIESRPDSIRQSEALIKALSALNVRARSVTAPGDSHRDVNVEFGQPNDPETQTALVFVR